MIQKKHNIVIFGGQGRTGREVAILAAKAGHNVTIFAHHDNKVFPEKLAITFVMGDARNEAEIEEAIKGKDLVINIIAPSLFDKKNYDISLVATKNIIAAMKKQKVVRYLSQCGAWATDDIKDASVLMRLVFKFFIPLKNIYRFKRLEDEVVVKSELNWTIFRAALLNNRAAKPVMITERYKCRFLEIPHISRKSLAKVYIENLDNTELFKKFVVVLD